MCGQPRNVAASFQLAERPASWKLAATLDHRLDADSSRGRTFMNVMRIFLLTALLAVGGFFVGWVVLPYLTKLPDPGPVDPPLVAATHTFPLLPEDRKLDREKAALAVDGRGRAV